VSGLGQPVDFAADMIPRQMYYVSFPEYFLHFSSDCGIYRLAEEPRTGKASRGKKVRVVPRRIGAYSKQLCIDLTCLMLNFLHPSLIKSGTDFRDLSEAMLELEEQPPGSIRRRVITKLTGRASLNPQKHKADCC
jgi:hypothetical protein